MSASTIVWAMGRAAGGPVNKLVLMLLADNADMDDGCAPSIEWLAEIAEIPVEAVLATLADLVTRGLIATTPDGWRLLTAD